MIRRKSRRLAEAGTPRLGMGYILRGLSVMLVVLLLLAVFPGMNAYAGETPILKLSLKVGSTSATVNGEPIVIQKPFTESGAVMVPLGIFKKAFGSTISLEGNDVVKVMYGAHTGAMTIGSTTAWKDGVKIKLAAPPRMVSGVLMVPLRFVTGVLGARITAADGGGLLVTLTPSEKDTIAEPESGIDSDVGKTRIGNSYFEWSMNYPPGLVVGDSGGNENVATFMSAENDYYLEVHASPQEVLLDPEGLLENLVRSSEEGGETVLDREVVPEAKVPYARIVSKDSSGALWEGRQYYADGRLYEIYLTDDNAVNYKDLDQYVVLLDSFQPSYNSSDKSIRDLSTVTNGQREGYNEDYGISLLVPADWSVDDQHLYYESKQGSYLRVKVSSAPAGSTLESWSRELESQLRDTFVTEAYTLKNGIAGKVSGEPVLINEIGLNPGSGWNTEYQILLLKNGYRYYFEYRAESGQDSDKARFTDVLNSIDIDFAQIKENFGRLETDDYALLSTKSVTKISKAYGYSVDIPRLWTPYQDIFESQTVEYRFTGGRFQIYASPDVTMEYAVSQLQSYYQNTKKDPKGPQVKSVEETTFAGVPATILTVQQTRNSIPVSTRNIIFGKNDVVYTITVTLNDANATASQQAVLERVLGSFGWGESS